MRARRQARHVEATRESRRPDVAHGTLDALADDVELALERRLRPASCVPRPMKIWRISGMVLRRQRAALAFGSTGTRPPAEELLALLAHDLLEQLARTRCARCTSPRQEHHADAVLARVGQRDVAAPRMPCARNASRHLDEDAGAVAGQRVAAAGAAVRQVLQDLQALLDDRRATASPLMLATKPTPQASCSKYGVVQALSFGRSCAACFTRSDTPLQMQRVSRRCAASALVTGGGIGRHGNLRPLGVRRQHHHRLGARRRPRSTGCG